LGPGDESNVTSEREALARATAIVDANRYMTLATADEAGHPWASPVWYATDDYLAFFWVSSPEARHSGNIAVRRQIAIVIFDSQVPVGSAQALYMRADAEELGGDAIDNGLEIFSRRSREQGLPEWTRDDVQPPARNRLYRAGAFEHFLLLTARDERLRVRIE
jgi:uncharacterized protein YhbP (UPF0306 family)